MKMEGSTMAKRWSYPRAATGAVIDDPDVLTVCARPPSGPRPRRHERGERLIVEYERPRVYLDRDSWEAVEDARAKNGVLVMRVRPRDQRGFDLAFTAAELEEVFGEVRQSESWDTVRAYHFPRPPQAVEAFVVKREAAPEAPSPASATALTTPGATAAAHGAIVYPFPLRPDTIVQLQLPRDLKTREAARIAAFITSLAIDDAE
jgi:hypothetical protein